MADPVESLGAFPIIQIAVAGVIAIGGLVALWRGVVSKSQTQRRTAGEGTEWFFDGPIGKVIAALEGIYRELKQSREDQQRYANERNKKLDEQTALLRNICNASEHRRR